VGFSPIVSPRPDLAGGGAVRAFILKEREYPPKPDFMRGDPDDSWMSASLKYGGACRVFAAVPAELFIRVDDGGGAAAGAPPAVPSDSQ
jgi:hypothetical protein